MKVTKCVIWHKTFPFSSQKWQNTSYPPKKSHVIKKPKSTRKILQNKFKPIKNIKLQNIFTKNPKNPDLAHPLLDTLRPARETKQRSPNREAVYSFYLMVLLINKQSQTHYGFLTTNIFLFTTLFKLEFIKWKQSKKVSPWSNWWSS